MKVYCCRLKSDHKVYMKVIHLVGENYVPVEHTRDITFSGDLEGMQKLVTKYPEFEVCCVEAEPVLVELSAGIKEMRLI